MHPDTLGGYERGDTFADQEFLTRYKREFSVNLDWLITGEGEMFASRRPAASAAAQTLDVDRLERAIAIIEQGLSEAGRIASPDIKAGLVSAAYEILENQPETAIGPILRLVKS